jgi:hypothetical protein
MKPVRAQSNRIIAARQRRRQKQIHEQRLAAIVNRKKGKGTLDNKPPRTMGMQHLVVNAKRDAKMELRFDEIERQNRLLLKKMTKIMKKKVFDFQQPPTVRSLNLQTRRRKMMRINHDNRLLLERINKVRPRYSKKKWDKERKENEHIIKNLSKFHPDELFKRQPSKASTGAKSSMSVKSNVPTRPATTTTSTLKKSRGLGGGGRSGRNIRNFGKRANGESSPPNKSSAKKEEPAPVAAVEQAAANETEEEVAADKVEQPKDVEVAAEEQKSPEEMIVAKVFQAINPDAAGTIPKRKFVKAVQLNTTVQTLLGSNEQLKHLLNVKQLQATFKKIDENDDGEISIEELVKFSSEVEGNVPV